MILTCDITTITDPLALLDKKIEIDRILGGDPCHGFSLSGKRDKNNPRNSLFLNFISYVKAY
ncbi:DNA cytosine methyltransferase [Mycoplasma corogypsi]|uniref:DNA cytosine methyltransferase n=1 Tax=Mycoplasma corogypsi TaxID=2106 RepID=UPI0038739877